MTCAIVSALSFAAFCVALLVADGRRADRLERERHARQRRKADEARP